MKTTVSVLILLVSTLLLTNNALANCDREKGERNTFRDLCLGFSGASGLTVKIGMGINPWLGLLGLVPGGIAQNQCRIWGEKESNLAQCEQAYLAAQRADLNAQRAALEKTQRRNSRLTDINKQYDSSDEAARTNHKTAVRALMQQYMQQGRNMRDVLVQAELKADVHRLEEALNSELHRLAEERQREINAID